MKTPSRELNSNGSKTKGLVCSQKDFLIFPEKVSILKCVPEYDILSGNICLNTYKKTLNLNNYGSLFKVYSTWRSSFSSSPSCFPCWRSSYILYIMYREVYSEILSTVITSLTLQSKISQIFITYITILLRKSSARWLPPRSAILSNRTSVLLGVIKLDACTASIRMRSSGTSKCGPPHNTYSACRGSSRTVLRTRNH